MNNLLVVGSNSVTGSAVFHRLSDSFAIRGLTVRKLGGSGFPPGDRISKSKLRMALDTADVVIFCGEAAVSSWTDGFGTFDTETQWLEQCTETANQRGSKLIMVSSDVVFTGPWVFS